MAGLEYALLGLLARQPATGYELAQQLKRGIGFFWQARHSQIYPELARLEQQDLVSVEHVEQSERPDKKIYRLTAAGRAALAAWVTAPLEAPAVRDELVLKAYCTWLAEPARAAALFESHAQQHEELLARYQELQTWLLQQWEAEGRAISSPWFGSYLALQRGIGYEREYAAWCRWVAEQVEGGAMAAR